MMESGIFQIMARGQSVFADSSSADHPVPAPTAIPVNPSNQLVSARDHPPKTARGPLVVLASLLLTTSPGRALTYQLAGTNASWPADKRAAIVSGR